MCILCIWVYMCVYVYECMFVWVHGLGCVLHRLDPFGEIRTHCKRLKFVFVNDPIHWRFEDQPIGWYGDSYRFVQWRPDGDSVLEPRHFMWVFVYWSISILVFLPYCFMWMCILFWIIFFMPSTIVISWCSHIVLWIYRCSLADTFIVLFWYSKLASISYEFPY